ncbi:MAG: mobile mystery protein A [Methylovirgula sp.]|uniref:mobile mystery protein A n=1 Tax=Methylovirgula sp. TaxID=1978224 RepID=UPI003075F641
MDRRQTSAAARRSLDRTLALFRPAPRHPPAKGWIRALRDALGMTAEQLGDRMGISQPSVQRLEQSEASGTIQLGSLRKAAAALDCEVVYALVPRRSLQETYQAAALRVARRELGLIDHTMALEDQAVGDEDDDERLKQFIAEELDPRELWGRRS